MGIRDSRHISYPGRRGSLSAITAFLLATQGCSSAMTAPTDHTPPGSASSSDDFTNTVKDWPLRFLRHNFTARCFNTQRCSILYAGMPHGSDEPTPSWQSTGFKHDEFFQTLHLSIANFPPPAVLDWVSKDGTSHHATVDIGNIFKDRLIRHNVPREEVKEGVSIGDPNIAIEVDDRTVNVYTQAHIPTKHLQIPGNKYSDFRDDLIKVYSKTY